jgi:hypothetical protein
MPFLKHLIHKIITGNLIRLHFRLRRSKKTILTRIIRYLLKFSHFPWETAEKLVFEPLPTEDPSVAIQKTQDRTISIENQLHQLDLQLRKLIHDIMHNYSQEKPSKKEIGQNLQNWKKQLLQEYQKYQGTEDLIEAGISKFQKTYEQFIMQQENHK